MARNKTRLTSPAHQILLSSFIRSQQVTGKVEGNHSNLSKIIGKSVSLFDEQYADFV
jgi:hypothetical protein